MRGGTPQKRCAPAETGTNVAAADGVAVVVQDRV